MSIIKREMEVVIMKKILVVDDAKNIRLLLTTCLEIEGFEVKTACDGNEALKLFDKEYFDLAFLDIKMPEVSGTEVLRRIRKAGVDTPVVIMTAFATVKNAVECTKMGAVQYLQKPFTTEKVRSLLNELLNPCDNNSGIIEELIVSSRDFIEEGKYNEAYGLLKKALSIDPSHAEIFNLIGKVHEKSGNLEEAEKFYKASKLFASTH